VQDRQREEDAFYGTGEWRQGPRDAIVGRIESMTSVVIEMDEATVDGLRDGRAETVALCPVEVDRRER
jgi:hypothetical protein